MHHIFLIIFLFYILVRLYNWLRLYIKNQKTRRLLDIIIALPVYPLLIYGVISLFLPFITDMGAKERNRSIVTLLSILILLAVNYFYLRKNKEMIKTAKNTSEIIKALQAEVYRPLNIGVLGFLLSPSKGSGRRTVYKQDLFDILNFDAYLHQGEDVEIPKMRTDIGESYLKAYLHFYADEHPFETTAANEALQRKGAWCCSCGRENPSYTSTCVCGKNKTTSLGSNLNERE